MKDSPTFKPEDNPDKEVHNITVYVSKGVTGAWVGHVKEIPGVIIQADDKDKLEDELVTSLDLMIVQYPEVHDKLWPGHVSAKGVSIILKDSLQTRMIEVTVPPF